jgi:steroid delta-isomerase-like uncharacterized protein
MSEQENVTIVRQQIDALNHHDVPAADRYYAETFRGWAIGAPGELDKRGNSAYFRRFVDAFPDLHFDIKDILAQGDKVAVSWVAHGTHTAPLTNPGSGPIPATNQKVDVPGCTFYELRNNMIVRQDLLWDQVTLMSQLGLMASQPQSSQASRPGMTGSRG